MEEEAEECSSMLTGEEIPPTHDSRPPDSEGELGVAGSGGGDAASSTNVIVDDSPLQNQMQKNKESLKVKLMVRRPMNTLIEQGILPSPKASPALHEQRQKLERAKMGDMLRGKLAKRPDRQELVHRHILEDVSVGVDPSLCDKQRQLKRARLADTLSNQLQLRPGPLELIQKNILHTDDSAVEQAVKEGQITFRPTNEGLPLKQVDLPDAYTINSFDDDSNSEGVLSPPSVNGGVAKSESSESVLTAVTASPSQVPAGAPKQTLKPVVSQADVLAQQVPVAAVVPTTVQAVAAATTAAKQKAAAIIASSAKGERGPSDVGAAGGFFAVPSPPSVANCSTSSASSVNSVLASVTAINNSLQQQQQQQQRQQQQPYSRRGAPGKDQTSRKKKVKPKPSGAAQKSRTIKFHEYKGPPSAQKKASAEESANNKSDEDTPYDLLLKQQQMYLAWQLEQQQKFSNMVLTAPKTSSSSTIQQQQQLTSPNTLQTQVQQLQQPNSLQTVFSSKPVPSSSGSSSSSAMAAAAATATIMSSGSSQTSSTSSGHPSPASSAPQTPRATTPVRSNSMKAAMEMFKRLERMEDLKVPDLKAELKRRSLPVSGPKPILIERLKQHFEHLARQQTAPIQPPLPGVAPVRRTTITTIGGVTVGAGGQLFRRSSKESSPLEIGIPLETTGNSGQNSGPATPQSMAGPPSVLSNHSSLNSPMISPGHVSHSSPTHMSSGGGAMADSPMMIQQFSPKNVNAMDLEGEFELDVMDTADAGARVATPPVIPIPPPPPPPPPPTHSLKRHHNQIATASAFNVSKPTFNITTSESSKVPPSFSISMPRPPHSASGNTASSSLTVTVTPLENSVTKNIAPANLTLSTPFVLPQQPVPVAQLIKKQEQLNQPSSSPATTNNGQTGMTSAAVPLHSVQRKVVLLPSKLQPPQQQQQQQQQQNPPSVIQPHQNATQQPTVYLQQQQQQQSMLAAPANAVIVQQAPQLLVQPPTPQPQENNQQPSAEDLIREQQKQIEELQQALQRSQRQLMQQTKILLDQQSQLNEANNNPQQNASQPSPADLEDKKAKNADHVKLLMNQQIQNKQLQNQIQELKAMQLKVQEHQQSVSLTLNTVAGLQQQQQQGESGSQQQQSQNQTSVAKNQVVLKPAAHVLMDRMKNNVRKSVTPSSFIDVPNNQHSATTSKSEAELPPVITQTLQQSPHANFTFASSNPPGPMLPSSPVPSGSLILAASQPHQEQQQQDGQQQHQQQLDEQSHHLEDFGEPKQENIEDILALLLQQGGGGGSDLGQTNGQDSYPNMTGVAPPPPPPPPNRKKASEHQLPTTNPSADQLQLLNFFDLADFDVSSLEELTAPAPSNNQMHHHQQQQQLQQSQPRLSTTTTTFSNGSQQPSHNSLTTTPADKFGSNNCNGGTVITSDGMEVDQDVADWLDSLLPTSQQGQEVGMDQEQSTSSGLIQHTGDTSAKNSLGCETNGNTILQCSSSDPLMTTMSGSSGITSSSASSLSFLADDTDMKNVEGGIWDKVS